jgi:hypothetical protein
MEQYKTIHQLKSETNIGISAEEKIRKLILSTPNDQELGKIIRELYGQN